MTKNILFDLGNVLLKFDWDIAYKRLATHLNPLTALLLWARKDEFLAEIRGDQEMLETGRMTSQQFFSRLKGKIGLEIDYSLFEDIWCNIFTLNQDVMDFARALGKTYSCYILSNTNEAHMRHVSAQYDLGFFKGIAVSHELGALKPAREFYDRALAKLALDAAECIFIDDMAANVEAARAAGIESVRFESAAQLRDELGTRGIVPA
ncbi:HAD-IA family hydrolase [bacterium]|nr:HAD-IA family hydrolase [bacterium]